MGKLQKSILDYISSNPGPHSFETVRWEMFKADPVPTPHSPDRKLPTTWNWNFERAIRSLEANDRKELTVTRRHLQSKAEFVRHYPSKTLNGEIRDLRLKLLAPLTHYGDDEAHSADVPQSIWNVYASTKAAPQFTAAENEQWFLDQRPIRAREQLKQEWIALEPELFGQMSTLAHSDQKVLFSLIARGKTLFRLDPIDYRRSLADCVQPILASQALPPVLMSKLAHFCDSVVPPETIEQLRFKSFIRSLAHVPRHGNDYRLVDSVLDYLNKTCADIMAALPGYQPAPVRRKSSFVLPRDPRPTYPLMIHKLLDNTVFAEFKFLGRYAIGAPPVLATMPF